MSALLQRIKACIQPRFVPGRGVFVQNTFLNCLVQRRSGLAEGLSGGRLVAFGERFTHVAERGAQAGGVAAVTGGASFSLTGAFKRRKMVCHLRVNAFSVGSPAESPLGSE